MSSLFTFLLVLHVVVAILGLGPLTALAVITTWPLSAPFPPERTRRILGLVQWALAGMFLTGIGMITFTHGVLGRTGWMRVSFVLFLTLASLSGFARRRLRRAQSESSSDSLKPVRGILWSMCVLIAVITYFMEAKPW